MRSKALFRHAVRAAQGALLGDGDAQVAGDALRGVDLHDTLPVGKDEDENRYREKFPEYEVHVQCSEGEGIDGGASDEGDAGARVGEGLRVFDHEALDLQALDVGLGGVTYGRFVWQHPHTSSVIKALNALIHHNASVKESLAVYDADVAAGGQ
mgnify:CR=1 FL=1